MCVSNSCRGCQGGGGAEGDRRGVRWRAADAPLESLVVCVAGLAAGAGLTAGETGGDRLSEFKLPATIWDPCMTRLRTTGKIHVSLSFGKSAAMRATFLCLRHAARLARVLVLFHFLVFAEHFRLRM